VSNKFFNIFGIIIVSFIVAVNIGSYNDENNLNTIKL